MAGSNSALHCGNVCVGEIIAQYSQKHPRYLVNLAGTMCFDLSLWTVPGESCSRDQSLAEHSFHRHAAAAKTSKHESHVNAQPDVFLQHGDVDVVNVPSSKPGPGITLDPVLHPSQILLSVCLRVVQ